MKVTIQQKANHPDDWHIGYLNDVPAIGDGDGRWFVVDGDHIIHNGHAGLVWVINQSGVWECLHEKLWPADTLKNAHVPHTDAPDYIDR